MTATDSSRSLKNGLLAAIWLVFLALPAWMIIVSPAGPAAKAAAWAGLAAFALVYVGLFTLPGDASQRRVDRMAAVACTLLVLCCAAMWPAIGVGVIATLPYFGAVLLFRSPIRRAPWIVAGCVAAAASVSLLTPGAWGAPAAYWNILGPLIGLFCVTAGRYAEHSSEKAQLAEQSLAITEERSRIGRDVHDLLGHSLTAISVKAQLAARLIGSDPAAARREIEDIQALTREGLAQVRSTVTEIRSESLENVVAMSREALASGGVRLTVTGESPAPGTAAAALFPAVLREATTNILRHARASACTVTLTPRSLTVEDDGEGLAQPHAEGHGLSGLRQRVEHAGGRLEVGPGAAGRGVRLGITMDS